MEISLNDVYLLQHFHKKKVGERLNEWQQERYGSDYLQRLEKLQEEGYITVGSGWDSLFMLTVPELKDILREHGQKVSGKKQDLIERIQLNIPEKEYEDKIHRAWFLTGKGSKAIKDNALFFINEEHNWGFLKTELEQAKQEYIERNHCFIPNDIFWGLFIKRGFVYAQNLEWSNLATNHYNMALILLQEKRYEGAIRELLLARYISYSGMTNGNMVESYRDLARLEYFDSLPKLSDALVAAGKGISYLDEIFDETVQNMSSCLPFKYFDDKTVLEIIKNELAGNPFASEMYKTKRRHPSSNSKRYIYFDLEQPRNPVLEIPVKIKVQSAENVPQSNAGCGCLSCLICLCLLIIATVIF